MPPVTDESHDDKFIREVDNTDRRDEVKLLYGIQLKSNSEREKDLTQNLIILWATIMGQCTPALQEEVHGEPDLMSKSSTFDSVWLLQSLPKITAGVNKTKNKYHSAFKATKTFYGTQQNPTLGIDEFYNRFENAKDLVGLFNADVVDLTTLLADEQKTNPTAAKETTMQKFLLSPSLWVLTRPNMNPCGTNWTMISLLGKIRIQKQSENDSSAHQLESRHSSTTHSKLPILTIVVGEARIQVLASSPLNGLRSYLYQLTMISWH